MKRSVLTLAVLVAGLVIWNCGGSQEPGSAAAEAEPAGTTEQVATENQQPAEATPPNDLGVGPITEPMQIPETIDEQLAQKGEEIFKAKCTACHKIDEKYIGPAVRGVTKRRRPEWIMNMILAPEKMIQQDPVSKQLVIESNGAIMANQGLTEEEARAVLEYFRKLDQEQS